MQGDGEVAARRAGGDDDAVDDLTDGLGRLRSVVGVGESIADAYDRLYYIERAAQVQIYAMWTGQPLKKLPDAVVEKTKRDISGAYLYKGPTPAQRHFAALKRILDRREPDYAS